MSLFADNEYLTVSQLNGLIRDVLNMGFPQAVWLCGEIQGYERNKDRKHIFFELCEKDPDSKDIVARIGLVIFANRKNHVEEMLASAANAFSLKDDIEVKFLCKVDFYPPHGDVRLIVETVDPVYTLGKIAQEKQKLIAALKEKGVLDRNKALPLPAVPLKVGLISAYDSAAYNDFISELKLSGYGFKVFFKKALMQGKGAERDVCQALDLLNRAGVDVIVITRGGGSIAELSCFDSRAIAERIASSGVPVLSGIGHEINITVTDMAAHTHQKTPTAIARFLIQQVDDFLSQIEDKAYAVLQFAYQKTDEERRRLKNTALELQRETMEYLRSHRETLVRQGEFIRRQPFKALQVQSGDLDVRAREFVKAVKASVKDAKTKLKNYERIIAIAGPAKTLRRGFSVTRTGNGRLVVRPGDVKAGEMITTEILAGVIRSRVQGSKAKEE